MNKIVTKIKKHKIIASVIICIVIVALAFGATLIFMKLTGVTFAGIQFDISAKDGGADIPTLEQVTQELQKQADESMFSLRINSEPVFKTGESEGSLFIGNPSENILNMQVSIILDSNGETIYDTDVLKPGEAIDTDKLDKVLEKGGYDATAIFTALDAKTNVEIGQTTAQLKIIIEG